MRGQEASNVVFGHFIRLLEFKLYLEEIMENNEEKKQIQLTKNDLIINRRLSKLFSLINNNFIPEKNCLSQ